MKNSLDQSLIKKAVTHLKSSDKILAGLIEKHGPCTIAPALDNPFHALVSSIISQQLSGQAARGIKRKLLDANVHRQFTPDLFLNRSTESLRSAGLSRPKIRYILGIAAAVKENTLNFSSLMKCIDEEIIEYLTVLPGVGQWTAEMFLIFALGRPDILSVGDAGLKRGFKVTYNLAALPSPETMVTISESWRPYRSVASWYLWRSIE